MKRFFWLFAVLLLLFFPSCTEEYPEPLYQPEVNTGEEKKKLSTEMIGGVFYDLYNDMTAQASYYDPEALGSSVTIPDQINGHRITKIGEECFRGSKLTEITFSEGLEEIGKRAFYQTSLISVSFPESLKVIGEEAFDNCRNLKSVTFSGKLERIGTAAFFGCGNIEKIDLSGGVRILEEEAFASLSSLKSLSLPDDLEEIGPYAFFSSGTDSLTIKIPQGVKKIGYAAFQNTAFEKTFTEEWVILGDGVLLCYNGSSPTPRIPEGVKYLAWDFSKNEITGLSLPESLEGICPVALENLKKIPLSYSGNKKEIQDFIGKEEVL